MQRILCLILVLTLALTSCTPKAESKTLALEDVLSLSEMTLALSWEDFEAFSHKDASAEKHRWEFPMAEAEYSLFIEGENMDDPPEHIVLLRSTGESIDIRVEDVQAFLKAEPDEEPISQSEPEPPKETSEPASPSSAVSNSQAQSSKPAYRVEASPASYAVDAPSITVKITNTSQVEGGYGYMYRIEREVNGSWQAIPLDFNVIEIFVTLPAGQTNTEEFSLFQEQYDYQPGTYHIVLSDGLGGASAQFTLE
ncbi:immunoglobulin-like domain-containing protein [Oscillospiraceae bacterium MB08-C2-2]|nr:immunoglobulin-like domain-containing protein [Oscillospiraceae bacterium MB08-C2-2]